MQRLLLLICTTREQRLWRRALHRWAANPHVEVLVNPRARQLPIVSMRLRHGEKYLHHNFVMALLNDLFGVQARGGCSCAGPYGHRLLAIDPQSQAFRDEIGHGCEGIKPGWVRINFNYFISDTSPTTSPTPSTSSPAADTGCSPTTASTHAPASGDTGRPKGRRRCGWPTCTTPPAAR